MSATRNDFMPRKAQKSRSQNFRRDMGGERKRGRRRRVGANLTWFFYRKEDKVVLFRRSRMETRVEEHRGVPRGGQVLHATEWGYAGT